MKTKCWTGPMIHKLRQKHGLRQKEFAHMLGCRQQTVSEWEMEAYSPGNAYCKVLTIIEKQLNSKEKIQIQ